MTHPHLEGLIRKWREAASVWHEKGTEYGEASAITLADCADELEAVSDVGLIGRSEKAVRVLSTMLRKAGLNEGASIADELLADLAKARVAAPALEGATLRAALQSCVDYGSSGWDDWILEKANAALTDRDKQYLFALSRDGSLIEVAETIAEIDAALATFAEGAE